MTVRAAASIRLVPPRGNAIIGMVFAIFLIAIGGYAVWSLISRNGAMTGWTGPLYVVAA